MFADCLLCAESTIYVPGARDDHKLDRQGLWSHIADILGSWELCVVHVYQKLF